MAELFKANEHQLKRAKVYQNLLNDSILGKSCANRENFPEPYPKYFKSVKAIVLGADPTNPRKQNLKFVFGLENERSPYFVPILKNLQRLQLVLDDIYVQNLCPNYFENVTDENQDYEEIALKYWLPFLKEELDAQFPSEVPVLVTAWKPLIVVAPEANAYKNKKSDIYQKSIAFRKNYLGRPVFAFFRGGYRKGYNGYYDIDYPEFKEYKILIKSVL